MSSALEPDDTTEREEILAVLADQIRTVDRRIEEMDPDLGDMEAQQVQIKWTRTLGYLAGQYRKLMKDIDIDDMEEAMKLLQRANEVDG